MPDQLITYPLARDLITVSRDPDRYDWDFDATVHEIPPTDLDLIHLDQLRAQANVYNEINYTTDTQICYSYFRHVQGHPRWVDSRCLRTRWAYRTCAECEAGYDPCHDDGCQICWPRPEGISNRRMHRFYRSWQQRRDGVSPWGYRGNPCDDNDCRICRPRWSLSLSELSALNAQERRSNWERHVARQRRELLTEMQDRAKARARELLQELCTAEQWETYQRDGHIPVKGSNGGDYLITKGYSGNVIVGTANDGYVNGRYTYVQRKCAHPNMTDTVKIGNLGTEYIRLPDEDAMIAQMLRIQADEQGWLEIANNY